MKRRWLRGLLLAVSMVMLLSGGLALAASLEVSVDKDCLPCWPYREPPTDETYLQELTITGWDPQYELCARTTVDGEVVWPKFCQDFLEEDPYSEENFNYCEWPGVFAPGSLLGAEVSAANQPPDPLGEWTLRVWQVETGQSARVSWRVVEDISECEEEEFVPEPASVMLLGSGLAGLAGYATLRWKAKEGERR